MNRTSAVSLVALCALIPFPIAGQDDEEEVFELSPFTVEESENHGYRASSTLAGSKLSSQATSTAETGVPFNDIGATIAGLGDASEAQIGQATGVTIEFAIGFYDDSEKTRRSKLIEYMELAREKVETDPKLYFEPGALRVAQGDRKKLKGQRRSALTSYAHFSVSFDIEEGASPFKRVASVRSLISSLALESEVTKVFFGDATATSESPYQALQYASSARPYTSSPAATSDLGATLSAVTDRLRRSLPMSEPQVAVTLVKPADAISVEFAIDAYEDLEGARRDALHAYLDRIHEQVTKSLPGVSFEPGAILMRQGDREGAMSKRRSAFASQAQFSLSFDIANEAAPLERIRSIRRAVGEMDFDPEATRVHYGPANLIVDDPNAYRGEILQAIHADLAKLGSDLGDRFEIEPKIGKTRVFLRQHSATEVELWIHYDYKVISVADRDLEQTKLLLEHEAALAKSQCCSGACCRVQAK